MKGNFRKIFYPAGIISLALLPLFCVCALLIKGVFSREHVLPITWMERPKDKAYDAMYPPLLRDLPSARKFTTVQVTSNDNGNVGCMVYARRKIHELNLRQDTVTGLRFHFSEDSKFKDLIAAIEICRKENVKTYVPMENDLWVLILPPPRPVVPSNEHTPMTTCGTGNYAFLASDFNTEPETQEKEKERDLIISSIEKYKISILLSLLLIFFAVWRSVKAGNKYVIAKSNDRVYLYRLKRNGTTTDHN